VGIWAGINGVAVAIGPVLGGVLVSAVGWRSIFLVAVPLGTLALALSLGVVRESADPQGRRLDLPGQVLAMLGIGALAVAAIGGQSLGWRSIPIVGAFLLAGVLLGGFICVEARSRSPLLPLDVFGNRALSGALGTMTATTFGMYGMLLLVPLYLQSVLAETPLGAGLSLVPLGLVFAVVSAPAGWLVGRVGARLPIAGGMALAGVGLAILAEAGQAPPDGVILVGMAIVGLALGLLTGPLMAVAVANVVPERAGLASGLVNVGRMLGATLGVAVLGSIFAALRHGGQDAETFVQAMRAALLVGAAFEWIGSLVALLTIAPTAAQGTQPRAQAAPTAGVRRYA
jgi:MFS family permease